MISSRVEIKAWMESRPSVDGVRPAHCVGCGAASRPLGGGFTLHGHGLVARQVRGPLAADCASGIVEIAARRYECQRCGAVMIVVPASILPRRHYSASSIALALFLWLLDERSDVEVRDRVCAWRVRGRSGARGWAQLYRWARDAADLFSLPRPVRREHDVREVATSVVRMLIALAPTAIHETDAAARVFAGAALAA